METDVMRKKMLQALMDTALEGDLARGVLWSGARDLPRRWLPHGSYYDLYTLYCSKQLSNDEKVASKSTFYRVLKSSGWKKNIKFSPPSSHSSVQFALVSKGRFKCFWIQAHADACDKLLRHLSGQFADRACYYECRSRSRSSPSDLLCIISDSMDRSKFSLPRFHRGRVPKDIENLKRLLVRWQPK